MSTPIELSVNGMTETVQVDGADTLLTVLRDQLGLTGTKRGCNQGVCGACTVLLDDRPVRACLTLAANCEGLTIATVEQIESHNIGGILQQAFIDAGAVQCGFCTPGMLISALDLLARNPVPSRDEIREGLAGNLCRCSGYRKIVDAVRRAAEEIGQ